MEENKKSSQELMDICKSLAEKHAELKQTVLDMLDEMDKIELEYIRIIKEIKKNER